MWELLLLSKRRWHKRSAVTEELEKQLQQRIELPPLTGLPLQQEGELEQELKNCNKKLNSLPLRELKNFYQWNIEET